MNLYDKDDGFKCFTVKEANQLLPEIIATTEDAAEELQKVKDQFERSRDLDAESAQREFESATARILQDWSRDVVELGVYPKGYFTVDFKTHVPDTLYCWTLGEHEISHTHKIYESFKERKPIQDKKLVGFEDSLN